MPLVGAISMDLTTLDVTGVPEAELGDVVTLYGRDGQLRKSKSRTSPREIVAPSLPISSGALGKRVPRYYV